MTPYVTSFVLLCAALVAIGLMFSCWIVGIETQMPWVGHALSALVLLPATYTAFVLTAAAWQRRTDTGHDGLNKVFETAANGLAGQSAVFPFVILAMLSLGLALQFVVLVAKIACPTIIA